MFFSTRVVVLGELTGTVGIIFEETTEPPAPVAEGIVFREEIVPVVEAEGLAHGEDIILEEMAHVVKGESLATEEDIAPANEVGASIIDSVASSCINDVVEPLELAPWFPMEGF